MYFIYLFVLFNAIQASEIDITVVVRRLVSGGVETGKLLVIVYMWLELVVLIQVDSGLD